MIYYFFSFTGELNDQDSAKLEIKVIRYVSILFSESILFGLNSFCKMNKSYLHLEYIFYNNNNKK